jgi:DNA-binding response OmpR family regulator
MITMSILHATLPSYMSQATASETKHFKVLSASSDLTVFRMDLAGRSPQVLVLDLALLGEDPVSEVERLEQRCRPELTLIVYAFARWEVVEKLRGPRRQVMRAPISVRMLHANLINLIVREVTQLRTAGATVTPGGSVPTSEPAARRYDDVQLASLQEIRSAVQCECPNQVADLVLALAAFEQYSRDCQNRNADDARVHAMLARATGHSRALMEAALGELCVFEKIDIDRLPKRIA